MGLHVEGVGVITELTRLEMEGKERERVKKRECVRVCERGEILNKQIYYSLFNHRDSRDSKISFQ